jgi:uncharacterized protein (TIGR02145 family)
MKETGTTHWTSTNTGATNESGFTGLPGGFRTYDGTFAEIGNYGYWWSSTAQTASAAWRRYLWYGNREVNSHYTLYEYGFSVRCIRD